ncbi:hypothetical protein TKK_0007797 [Trichogramma kaykai]
MEVNSLLTINLNESEINNVLGDIDCNVNSSSLIAMKNIFAGVDEWFVSENSDHSIAYVMSESRNVSFEVIRTNIPTNLNPTLPACYTNLTSTDEPIAFNNASRDNLRIIDDAHGLFFKKLDNGRWVKVNNLPRLPENTGSIISVVQSNIGEFSSQNINDDERNLQENNDSNYREDDGTNYQEDIASLSDSPLTIIKRESHTQIISSQSWDLTRVPTQHQFSDDDSDTTTIHNRDCSQCSIITLNTLDSPTSIVDDDDEMMETEDSFIVADNVIEYTSSYETDQADDNISSHNSQEYNLSQNASWKQEFENNVSFHQ